LDPSRSLKVFGGDYDTADGSAVRDFTHVTDLADAHVLALRHLLAGGQGDVFNLGTGHGHSVFEVIKAVERAAGRPLRYSVSARRPGDPSALVACSSKAQRSLGWKPKFTRLSDIIRSAWDWHYAHSESGQLTASAAG
jgi:UDP-glucose 4-epimerase